VRQELRHAQTSQSGCVLRCLRPGRGCAGHRVQRRCQRRHHVHITATQQPPHDDRVERQSFDAGRLDNAPVNDPQHRLVRELVGTVWQQSGSRLTGSIRLSTQPGTLRLTGRLDGTRITFGTVGSAAITYAGTVSGSSMSGTYQVGGASGGSWSANKSS
jgi:hypothetical protein